MNSEINYKYLASNNLISKYNDKGLTGLCNLGNTCYINSCMQILSHCYELNEVIDLLEQNISITNGVVLREWKSLKDLIWSKNCIISPNRFVNAIQQVASLKKCDLFTGYAQNDLPEFLIFIFDCFHEALERKVDITVNGKTQNDLDELAKTCYEMIKNTYTNSYSEIIDLFFGIHVSLIISKTDSNTNSNKILSIKPEPFSIINLPLPLPLSSDNNNNNNNTDKTANKCSIYDCFDLYTNYEFLEGSNAWFNEKTNLKQDVVKTIKFWSLPNILIVDFKKFNNFNRKLNIIIHTPLIGLDLSKYVVGYNRETYIYELFGICNHNGESQGGHYTAYIKNANQKWYNFNDTNINEIDESQLITANGYCYFYRKLL
jgi:ubiquitin C-terminal hydrolase